MRKIFLVLVAICLVTGLEKVYAGDQLAAGLKLSTLGPGAEAILKLNHNFNARVGGNGFSHNYNGTQGDIEYGLDLKLLSFSFLADWFPFKQGLRLSGGLIINENKLDMTAKSNANYHIGNVTYSAAQAGTVTGRVDFNKVAPYAGIGWGNPFGKNSNWSINFDLGVMFQGSPHVDLSANGTLANNAAFLTELDREKDNVRDDVKKYQYYPVAAIGVTYKF